MLTLDVLIHVGGLVTYVTTNRAAPNLLACIVNRLNHLLLNNRVQL